MAKPGRKSRSDSAGESNPAAQRINKYLAAAGLGSRRDVEELIVQGRVEIDGEVVTNLATRVDPSVAKIKVDGVQLKPSKLVYYALNKPKGVLSTNEDPTGRTRVIDLVPDKHRVFSVGRLDLYSEGLILLTNDGDLAQRLAHPRYRVQKTYFVVVAGVLTKEELAKLRKGVYLAEGVARIDGAQIRKTRKTYTELEILLSEGKNREIRRILARAGHKVMLLRRIAIGPLRLAELPVGAARELTSAEVKGLYACTQASRKAAKTAKPAKDDDSAVAKTKPKVTEKIVTPIESEEFEDFGLGLEQDYQYDESQLVPSDDAIEFGGGEEDWDDDFGGDFQSMSTGSVLAYDEEEGAESNEQAAQSTGPRSGRPAAGRDRSGRDGGRRDSSGGGYKPRRAPAGPGGAKRRSFRSDSDTDGERSERPRRPAGRSGFGGRSSFSSGSSDRRPTGRPRSDRSSGYAGRDRDDAQAEGSEEPRRSSGPRSPRFGGGGPRGGSRPGGSSRGPRSGGAGPRRGSYSDRDRSDSFEEGSEAPRFSSGPRGPRSNGSGPRGGSRPGGGSRGPRPGGAGPRRGSYSDRDRSDSFEEGSEAPRRSSGPRGGSRPGGSSRGPRPGGAGPRRSSYSDRDRSDSFAEGSEAPRRSGPRGPRPGGSSGGARGPRPGGSGPRGGSGGRPGSGGPRGGSRPGGSSGPRGTGRPSGGRPSSGGGPRGGGSRPGGAGPRGGGRPGSGGGRPSSGPRGGGRPGGGSRGGGRPGGR